MGNLKRVTEYFQPPRRIWVSVFVYTLLAGLAIQLLLLPYVFPAWHAGDGLIRGLDGRKFNGYALEQAEAITREGWQAWGRAPRGQFVAGVASILYVLIYPKPLVLLPLNAALNATAAVCMVLLLRRVTGDMKQGTLAALPFVFFPSSLLWHAQLHNENYAVPGVCMLLLGWSGVVGRSGEDRLPRLWVSLLLVAAGSLLIGAVRIYIVGVMLVLFVVIAAVLTLAKAWNWARRKLGTRALTSQIGGGALGAITMAVAIFALYGNSRDSARLEGVLEEAGGADIQSGTDEPENAPKPPWRRSALPRIIDNRFRELAWVRATYTVDWADSGSVIDGDVQFGSVSEVIGYLPRALQVSLFAPFPNIWFTAGRKVTGAVFRAAVVPETLVAYACLLGLPAVIYARRRKPQLWVVLAVCTGMLMFYAVAAPNQGSLFRFRFPYYLPLVCLGLSGWLSLRQRRIPVRPRTEGPSSDDAP